MTLWMGPRRLAGLISNGVKGLGAPRLPRLEGFRYPDGSRRTVPGAFKLRVSLGAGSASLGPAL